MSAAARTVEEKEREGEETHRYLASSPSAIAWFMRSRPLRKPRETPDSATTSSGKYDFHHEYLQSNTRAGQCGTLGEKEAPMSERGREGDAPLSDLLEVRLAREPHVERVAPLWEELGLEQLREHRAAQERAPREDGLERREVLRARVDDELLAQESAELRQDVLEEERVPVALGEGLQGGRRR